MRHSDFEYLRFICDQVKKRAWYANEFTFKRIKYVITRPNSFNIYIDKRFPFNSKMICIEDLTPRNLKDAINLLSVIDVHND